VPVDDGNVDVSGALSLTLFTENEKLEDQALYHPDVSKVSANGTTPTNLDPTEPHKGYITDKLLSN
jgi:hypothetical protein